VGPPARPFFLACYTEAVRRLIVNADDFGMTRGINRAIVEGCEQGIVTSATLMANSGAFEDAVRRADQLARNQRPISVGCHIVLLDGEPVLPPDRVCSLLEPVVNGGSSRLRTSLSDFARCALTGKLIPEEIEAEADAQFERIQAAGLALSHFDCHKHTHMFPAVLQPLLRAAKARGIRAVRNPFGKLFPLPIGRVLRSPKLWTRFAQMSLLRNFATSFQSEVQKHGLRTPDGSVGVLVTGVLDPSCFACIAENLPEGTWEFVCHPGYDDADLDQIRTRLRQSREQELAILTSPEAKAALQQRGIELISYHDL
jgi:chitin disaccharide deacetylase